MPVIARSMKALSAMARFQKLLSDIKEYEEEIQTYERLSVKKSANDQYLALRMFIGAYDDHLRSVQPFCEPLLPDSPC